MPIVADGIHLNPGACLLSIDFTIFDNIVCDTVPVTRRSEGERSENPADDEACDIGETHDINGWIYLVILIELRSEECAVFSKLDRSWR
jgi:hypothetical protein